MDLKKHFNSGSKKRDLSSETSNNPDDVLTEGLSSHDCVKILYNCIKNVENQIQFHNFNSFTILFTFEIEQLKYENT